MQAGLTYDHACTAYSSMLTTMEDAIANRDKIYLGNIGSLTPIVRPPRDIAMSFVREKGDRLSKTKRVFHLEERTDYRFRVFKKFAGKHGLR